MHKIDEIDLKIIREFQKDARQSYRDIAMKLKVSEGTVYNRTTKLKELGVIKRFIADIDYSALGYDLTAIIGLSVEGGHLQHIEKQIAKEPSISAVYDVTGEYDVVLVAKFKERSGLNKLVKSLLALPEVKRTNTMIALNVVKEDHGISL